MQCCGSGASISSATRSIWIRIRIQDFDDKIEKNNSAKIFFFLFLIIKCYFLGLYEGSSYRRSIRPQKEHPALAKIKFINCFLFFWAIFAILDPDPDTQHWSYEMVTT